MTKVPNGVKTLPKIQSPE